MKQVKSRSRQRKSTGVLTQTFRVSAAQHFHTEGTASGIVLAPGYYVALWPDGVAASNCGREVRYFGPFATLALAQSAEASLMPEQDAGAVGAPPSLLSRTPAVSCGPATERASLLFPPDSSRKPRQWVPIVMAAVAKAAALLSSGHRRGA